MNIHNNKTNKQALISKSILTTSIFSTVAKRDFNKKVSSVFDSKEYSVEISGYQPNLDIDFNMFSIFIRENRINKDFEIDDLIKKLGQETRIQKRDRERVLQSLRRMMHTVIIIKNKNFEYNFNLINEFYYDNKTKTINVDLSSVKKLYDKETFKKFLSVNELLELNQYEKSIFLLVKSQEDKLFIKEEQLFKRIGLNTCESNTYINRNKIKNTLSDLKKKKIIHKFKIKNNIYEITPYNFDKEIPEGNTFNKKLNSNIL